MLIIDMLTWWWTRGWWHFIQRLGDKLRDTLDLFSFGALIRTLFAPFRQISADEEGVSLGDRARAAFDRLFSRIIGAVVRIFLMIAGVILLILELALSAILIVGWLIVPLLPVASIILIIAGVAF